MLEACRHGDDFQGMDLLALQEASRVGDEEDASLVAQALGAEYRYRQVEAHVLRGRVQANALIWNQRRVEVCEMDAFDLPLAGEVSLSRPERAMLRVLHKQRRMCLRFECLIAKLPVRIYVAHLDVVGYRHKMAQFHRILADHSERPPVPLAVIAGDLNTFRIVRAPRWTRLQAAAAAAGFEDLTSDIGWTHSVSRGRLRQKLDAIFLSGEHPIEYTSWSLPLPGSDHIPVFAELLGWAAEATDVRQG